MRSIFSDRLLILATALILAVASVGGLGALSQVGKTFPGFLVLGNGVVASIGLSWWPATAGGDVFQHEIVSLDGVPVGGVSEIHERVRALPAGTPVRYVFRRGETEFVRSLETRTFAWRDFVLLHGMYLLNGLALGGASLVALGMRRRSSAALACAPLLLSGAAWVLSAMDLYGPYRLFRLHALAEALLFPGAIVMALGFPEPARLLRRFPGLPRLVYGLGVALAIAYQWSLASPDSYVLSHLLAVSCFGFALLLLIVSEIERYRHPLDLSTRERLRVLATGVLVAFALPVCLTIAELLTGGRSPQNPLALTGVIFPLTVAYSLLRGGLGAPGASTRVRVGQRPHASDQPAPQGA